MTTRVAACAGWRSPGGTFAVHPAGTGWSSDCGGSRSLRVQLTVSAPTEWLPRRRRHPRAADPRRAADEALRLPVDAARSASGRQLQSVALSYLFERTTGDDRSSGTSIHGPASTYSIRATPSRRSQRLFELPGEPPVLAPRRG